MLVVVLLATGIGGTLAVVADTAKPARAEAWSGGCSGARCTIYLNRSETHSVAYGYYNPMPGGALRLAFAALREGHRYFAQSYYNRGYCVAFRLSAYPWENQGMFPYRC